MTDWKGGKLWHMQTGEISNKRTTTFAFAVSITLSLATNMFIGVL